MPTTTTTTPDTTVQPLGGRHIANDNYSFHVLTWYIATLSYTVQSSHGDIVMDKAVGCYAYGNMFCWL